MRVSANCIRCLVDKQEERVQTQPVHGNVKARYMKAILQVIGTSDEETSAPELVEEITKVYETFFGEEKDFRDIKRMHNQKMLDVEDAIWKKIQEASDSVERAILYARAGNYIDYGAMKHVDEDVLKMLLERVDQERLDPVCYRSLRKDLECAKHLVYVTDNCGEIVMDKQLVRVLKEQYPSLLITVLVRGKQVLNDATIEDAEQIGMTKLVSVVENGTGIAGTSFRYINEESRSVLDEADVIIAKGQGNFESMYGCGRNIYYLFLCKCDFFATRFGLTKNAGVLMQEGDYEQR